MLQIESEGGIDAQDQGRLTRPAKAIEVHAGFLAGRPLQLDGPRHAGQSFADNIVPIKNEIALAESLFVHERPQRAADEIGEGLLARKRFAHGLLDLKCWERPRNLWCASDFVNNTLFYRVWNVQGRQRSCKDERWDPLECS